MNGKRTYKRYLPSFKEEAVALVTEQGYTVIEAAKSLGIGPNQLDDWKAKLEAEKSGEVLSVDEREELKRLRKEVKNLRMEKDILKKASVPSSQKN